MPFPKNFLWGAASSAYQIEGAASTDGRGPSVWDMYCKYPGATYEGHTGDVACDHYHRSREDVALMQQIGLQAYRFSLSWSRIMPDGTGRINEPGLAFYDKLVDDLLAAGIQPFCTLFHWDYPYELFCRGGWLNADSPKWFADYAQVVAARLGDRVKHWMTINEPQVFLKWVHGEGQQAAGYRHSMVDQLRASHHCLLAHGHGVRALRAAAKAPATVGWAPCALMKLPRSQKPEDIELARRASFAVVNKDLWNNAWFYDPILKGHYPEDGLQLFGTDMPTIRPGDMDVIATPTDFIGVNIYWGDPVEPSTTAPGGFAHTKLPPGHPQTALRWPVEESSLYWGLRFMHERYAKPLYVTENGLSAHDWVHLDGRVHDQHRIDFTHRYLKGVAKAMAEGGGGADCRGYFHWSIMDNFEWGQGYKERFGLIHVDYATQKRTLKDSALWYKALIAENGKSV
ncbi:MAG: GH1 family beta-glucosidase [Phycisphaerales bacterium]